MVSDEQTPGGRLGPIADEAHDHIHQRTSEAYLERHMTFDVAFTEEAWSKSSEHLLQHFRRQVTQEDLCFALWRPSTGEQRRTALIDEIILPKPNERDLHGNASFQPAYLARAIGIAREKNVGLAFMHSHPGSGWQSMSSADIVAERDVLAYPAGATGLPLVGLTIGGDGYWSARFWERHGGEMQRHWCDKVRIVGTNSYRINFNDHEMPPPSRREILRRTFDTWGTQSQNEIARMKVGIVGLGSVGCIVAESIARIGVGNVTLVDPDHVEEHNLDRLLYATVKDIGRLKVELAEQEMRAHSTSENIHINALPVSVHDELAYKSMLDCDIIFSCVDRPVARDVLNYAANAHLIPVIDGGIAVETDPSNDRLFSAHWRAHIVTPYHQCLRCNGQYNSSDVVMELDGSLDDPSYVRNLPDDQRQANQNVFPFSQSVAAMEINLMLRYLLAADWWPQVRQQEYQFMTGASSVINEKCLSYCSFRSRKAKGDGEEPFYLTRGTGVTTKPWWRSIFDHSIMFFGRLSRRA